MEHTKSQTQAEAPEKKPISRSVYAVSLGASGAAGLASARIYVSDAVYDNLKKHGAFTDIHTPHKSQLEGLIQQQLGEGKVANFATRLAEVKSSYYPEITKRIDEMGIKGLRDEWKAVHRSQRQNAAIIGMTVSSIMIGACLEVARAVNDYSNRKESAAR